MTDIDLTLIFPAFNEARVIVNTIKNTQTYLNKQNLNYEIIISADGTDGTREVVAELARKDSRLKAIGNAERKGKGYGIRQAVAIARGNIIGFADADDKTPITELDGFLPILANGTDIVIRARAQRKSVIERPQPLYRRLGSRGFGIFMHLAVALWDSSDTQCGFKFFPSRHRKRLVCSSENRRLYV